MKAILLALIAGIYGCGANIELQDQKKDELQTQDQYLELQGYISPAFDVVVNNRNYSDSEDFYTQQLDELYEEMAEEGLGDYSLTFDAQVGLDDLKNNMRVYAVPDGDSGFAGEAQVMGDGTFYILLPPEAAGRYQIRANKRINAVLTSPSGKEITWCYNFYGESNYSLYEGSLPSILKEFTTRLTKYKCQQQRRSSIKLPSDIHLDTNLEEGEGYDDLDNKRPERLQQR